MVYICFLFEFNGFLYVGYCCVIVLNFDLGLKYNGKINFWMDDINFIIEKIDYVDNIKKDIQWLGYEWNNDVFYVSDYFEELYNYVFDLIKKGLVYVDDFIVEEMVEMKGDIIIFGKNSFYCECFVEENFDFFMCMCVGEFEDGVCVLCVKIDMVVFNLLMCDFVLYCIKYECYYCIGDEWCIYLFYDFVYG